MKIEFPEIHSVSSLLSFEVSSGALRVTDPCYSLDTWCAGQLQNVMNGEWNAHVGYHKDDTDMRLNAEYLSVLREEVNEQKARWQITKQNYLLKMRQEGESEASIQEASAEFDDPRMFELLEERLKQREASVADYLGRVAYLHVRHSSEEDFELAALSDYVCIRDFEVGIDSGQAGFF